MGHRRLDISKAMPKKFANTNTKAAGKLAARADAKESKASAKAKQDEDDHWDGVNKAERGGKKDKKKEAAGASKKEKDARKAEARKLAKQEELDMLNYGKKDKTSKKKPSANKVTQKQLAAKAAKQKEEKEKEAHATASLNITTEDEYAVIVGQKIDNRSTDIEANNIDDALAAAAEMSISEEAEKKDMHPEKRMKAAYSAYEEAQMPIMKEDYPGLKRSQYKERIFQQWQKAAENPRNWPEN